MTDHFPELPPAGPEPMTVEEAAAVIRAAADRAPEVLPRLLAKRIAQVLRDSADTVEQGGSVGMLVLASNWGIAAEINEMPTLAGDDHD